MTWVSSFRIPRDKCFMPSIRFLGRSGTSPGPSLSSRACGGAQRGDWTLLCHPTLVRHSQPSTKPGLTKTQLARGAHPRCLTSLHRCFLRSVEELPRWVCRARCPGQHPIPLLGTAGSSFISQDPRFHPNIFCCLLF